MEEWGDIHQIRKGDSKAGKMLYHEELKMIKNYNGSHTPAGRGWFFLELFEIFALDDLK